MRKILTYTALIKTGVVTRNEGFGNTAPMKKCQRHGALNHLV